MKDNQNNLIDAADVVAQESQVMLDEQAVEVSQQSIESMEQLLSDKKELDEESGLLGKLSQAEGVEVAAADTGAALNLADMSFQAAPAASTGGASGIAAVSPWVWAAGAVVLGVAVSEANDDDDSSSSSSNSTPTPTPTPDPTYSLASSAAAVNEGDTVIFTLTTTDVAEGTLLDYTISGVNASDISGGQLTGKMTVDSQGKAQVQVDLLNDNTTEGTETLTLTVTGTGEAASVDVNDTSIDPVQTFNLTTGADISPEFDGTEAGDVYTAIEDTLTGLDSIDGKGGDDTLNIIYQGKDVVDSGATITSIETINIQTSFDGTDGGEVGATGAGNRLDLSSLTDTTTVNVTKAVNAFLKAGATTDLNVSGVTTAVELEGGLNQSVTTAGTTVDVLDAAGTVDVTHTAQAASDINVDNGTDVTVTAAGNTGGAINVGAVADEEPTGAVTVSVEGEETGAVAIDGGTDVTVTTTTSAPGALATVGAVTVGAVKEATGAVSITQSVTSTDGDLGPLTAGNVTVTGGSSIDITANLTTTSDETANITPVLAGTYTATAGDTTTSISVTQNTTANYFAGTPDTVAAVAEVTDVTFGALAAGEGVVISVGAAGLLGAADDLLFVANKALTAAEVAAAFANLTAEDTQTSGGIVENGTFYGNLEAGWTSGAASGDTVSFTAETAEAKLAAAKINVSTDADAVANLGAAPQDDAAADADFAAVVATAGTNGSGDATAANSEADFTQDAGAVVIDDNATASVTTVTVDGYDTAAIGTNTAMGALTTLNLANSEGLATLATTSTTLAVSVDSVNDGVDLGAGVTTLNLTANGDSSTFGLDAADAVTLTVTANADLDIATGSTLTDLETATISGAGSVNLGDVSGLIGFTALTAGSASGDITATVDSDVATVTTGAGDDDITVLDDISKAISLGDGDDMLTLAAASVPTANVNGGNGTDTLGLLAADAATLDVDTDLADALTSFERLEITDALAAETYNVENLGFNYITLAAGAAMATEIDQLASGGTVVFEAAGAGTEIFIKDAATSGTDVLNLAISNENSIAAVVTANEVETINLTVTDVFIDDGNGNDTNDANQTLQVTTNKTTSIVIDGDDATLDTVTVTTSAVTSVDGSALTGGLTYVADGATAGTTVKGGAGADNLSADGESDVLMGNAGDDTFNAGDLTQIYGGDGADIFNFAVISNITKTSTVHDAGSGDVFALVDAGNANTEVDEFYAEGAQFNPNTTTDVAGKVNAALTQTAEGEASWFQHGGNTYIVIDGTDNGAIAGAVDTYQAGTDNVIEVVGLFDLANGASFNATDGTLEIA
jgi:S-layer protein